MKALMYHGREDVRLEDVPEPELTPGTVRITPAYTGICGSDLHLYFHGPIPPAPTTETAHPISGERLPVVFGHEFSGTVTGIGAGVTGISAGDPVVVEPFMVCGRCANCEAGRYNLCTTMGFIGISGRGGGLSESIVVESRWVHPIGDLPLDQAALVEPLAVALHGVKLVDPQPGGLAVVGGAGPIGLLTAAVLKAYGLRVVVSEVSAARRATAERTGVADVVVDPASEDLLAVVAEASAGTGADLAFDCAGVAAVVTSLLSCLRAGGRLQVIALHTAPVEVDLMSGLIMREAVVSGSIGYCDNHPEAIELARSGQVDLAQFITRVIAVEDIVEEGFRVLHEAGETEVKILVRMNP